MDLSALSNNPVIVTSVIVILVSLSIWFFSKKKTKVTKDVITNPIVEDVSKKLEMVEVREFDSDAYVDDIFNAVFYSIQNDNWKSELSWEKIIFSKEKVESQYNRKSVTLTFTYRFEDDRKSEKRTFTIKDIILEDKSDYRTFAHKSILSEDVKIFVYKIYSDWVNESNNKKKEKADKSLINIKSVLGKACERGAKLDEILGN